MQFSRELRDRVADGTITVSYRLWSRPQVKAGGVYQSGSVLIEIDEIELVPFSSITDEDLALTGEPDLESLRRRAAHAGPIHDDTLVYRVEFHVVDRRDADVPHAGDVAPLPHSHLAVLPQPDGLGLEALANGRQEVLLEEQHGKSVFSLQSLAVRLQTKGARRRAAAGGMAHNGDSTHS